MLEHVGAHDIIILGSLILNFLWSALNLRLQTTLLDKVKLECPTRIEWKAANDLRDEKLAEVHRRMARARI